MFYRLEGVPQGRWHLRAVAVADSSDPEPWTRRTLLIGGCSLNATGGRLLRPLELRPKQPTDLPILLALPELESPLAAAGPPQQQPDLRADWTEWCGCLRGLPWLTGVRRRVG